MTLSLTATIAQWGLFIGNGLLLTMAVVIGWRWPSSRPWMVMTGALSLTHTLYYLAFLVFPEALNSSQTVAFSIAIRYQTMFTLVFVVTSVLRAIHQAHVARLHGP